jgi:uncharacterized membrane protein YqjE
MSKQSTDESFNKLLRFFITACLIVEEIINLFILEFKLAKRSCIAIIFCSIAFVFLLFSLWILFLLICIFIFNTIFHGWLISVILAAEINVLCIGITLWIITKYSDDLRFLHTRKHIFGIKEKHANDFKTASKAD